MNRREFLAAVVASASLPLAAEIPIVGRHELPQRGVIILHPNVNDVEAWCCGVIRYPFAEVQASKYHPQGFEFSIRSNPHTNRCLGPGTLAYMIHPWNGSTFHMEFRLVSISSTRAVVSPHPRVGLKYPWI